MAASNWSGPSGDWLKRHWRGDETLPVLEEEAARDATASQNLPENPFEPPLPALLPIVSPAVGAGVLYLKVKDDRTGAPIWKKYLGFSGEPWARHGRSPVYWWLGYIPRWKRAELVIVASPLVELATTYTPAFWQPSNEPVLTVVRVGSADVVPEPGEPLRLYDLIGDSQQLKNGVDLSDPDLTGHERFIGEHYSLTEDPITIAPRINGVTISQDDGQWRVDISHDTPGHRGAFVYELRPVDALPETSIRATRRSSSCA